MAAVRPFAIKLALLGLFVSMASCGDLQPTPPSKPAKPVVKLTVTRRGEYIADGAVVDLAQLDKVFADAHANSADVWCYREDPGEPPQAYLELIKVVAKHKILLQYVAEPDFSVPPKKKPLTINY